MGFTDRRSEKPSVSSGSNQGVGALTAFIDQGSEFTGKLSFKDTVRIDGTFEGEISSDNTLIVGESGVIEATIHSQVVIVSGVVNGDIFADKQVVLHKSARVKGSLVTGSLMVEDGAELCGQVTMGQGRSKQGGSPNKPDAQSKPREGSKG